jgi:hypothetical protein
MWRLIKYLEENESSIISHVDNAKSSEQDSIREMAAKLAEIWPGDEKITKDHYELGVAITWALWLGRRAQQEKEERGNREAGQFFQEAILQAFEAGKRSAITRA